MRRIVFCLFLLLLYCTSTFAYTRMDEEAISRAQEYGMMNYQKTLPEFAAPWAIYEEDSQALDNFAERVYLYTPYYLVAVNARERLLASQTINVKDGETIISSFRNSLPVGLVLYLKDENHIDELEVEIRQRGGTVFAYALDVQNVEVAETTVIKELVPQQKVENKITQQITEVDEQVFLDTDNATGTQEESKKTKKELKKEKKAEKKAKKAAKNKVDTSQNPQELEPQAPPVEVEPEPVYIEKTVPSLYKVQLFVYFDARKLNLAGQATLAVTAPELVEKRFNFSFDNIR